VIWDKCKYFEESKSEKILSYIFRIHFVKQKKPKTKQTKTHQKHSPAENTHGRLQRWQMSATVVD
jgi:hypothetical protein